MTGPRPMFATRRVPLAAEIAVAALLTAVFGFIYVNGAFFSPVSAPWVDFSINYTAAHAMRHGDNPYGEHALFDRAEAMGMPTDLIYRSLFTSYIQPPTSALSVLPLTLLGWPEAGRAYLVLNNLLLVAAIAIVLNTVRPSLPWLWAAVTSVVILALFNQVYMSFALGQVDATMAFLLALGLWGARSGRPALTGATIAVGTAIKLLPALLLLYFLWRREHRIVLWAVGVGAVLLVASIPAAGIDTYRYYLTETLPALTKGSTFYSNISIVGAITRPYIDGPIGMLDPIMSLEEVPYVAEARVLSLLATLAILGAVAGVLGGHRSTSPGRPPGQTPVSEYYLVVAVGLIISSVTWDFYVVWLLPFFVIAVVAPARVLHPNRAVWLPMLALLAVVFVGLNYPGDYVTRDLLDPNSVFYRPDLIPGVWVEDRLNFYGHYLDWVPLLRLGSLTVFALTIAGAVLLRRLERASGAVAPSAGALTPVE